MNKQLPTKVKLSPQETLNMLMNMLTVTENSIHEGVVVELPVYQGLDREAIKNQMLALTGVITLEDSE